MSTPTIPVICDRCRATGHAGAGDFSHLGDLLDFTPVPVRHRVNGWDPDAQRAFIALLASTGSKRRAAMAIGRNPNGIDQLLKRGAEADSFRTAFERAMAIAGQQGAMKLASGVADAAARNAVLAPPSRLRDYEPEDEPDSGMDNETRLAMVEELARKFMGKVRREREARLAGQIVAADFYLRQVTALEVGFDLMTEGAGLDGWHVLRSLRRGGHSWLEIAATPLSRALDDMRAGFWASQGDPPRPRKTAADYFEEHANHTTEPLDKAYGALTRPALGHTQEQWAAMDHRAQKAAREAQWAEAAAEQVEWEKAARATAGGD